MSTAMLKRKTMSTAALAVFAVSSSAVLVVLLGALPLSFVSTSVVAMPLLILLVGAVIGLLSVGYTSMARRVKHSAVYYSAIAHGLGRPAGVAGGLIALLGYSAITNAQFGFIGTTAKSVFHVGSWWMWALGAAALVAVFTLRGITASTKLLSGIFIASLVIVLLFDYAALNHPASGHLSSTGFATAGLTGGIGGGIAYAIASLMGFELPGAFNEEKTSQASIRKAVYIALGVLMGIYALTAYAVLNAAAAGEITPNTPLDFLTAQYGSFAATIVNFVLMFAILTSMVAFASVFARYTFAIAREEVLPKLFARTGSGESPLGGAWVQTVISVVVILGFAVSGADPMTTLFAWFSTLGALALLLLLLLTSLSALFSRRTAPGEDESAWTRWIAPLLGVLSGLFIFVLMLTNLGALLGPDTSLTTRWIIPLSVFAVGVTGLLWGFYLRDARPQVYESIGRKLPDTNTAADADLADLPL